MRVTFECNLIDQGHCCWRWPYARSEEPQRHPRIRDDKLPLVGVCIRDRSLQTAPCYECAAHDGYQPPGLFKHYDLAAEDGLPRDPGVGGPQRKEEEESVARDFRSQAPFYTSPPISIRP